jgi:hypothetical protein
MSSQLPAEALQFGPPLAEYKPGIVGRVLAAIIGVGTAVFGLFLFTQGSDAIVFALILLAFAGLCAWSFFSNLGRRVLVFPAGLVASAGGKTDVIRWEQIAGVWQSVTKQYVNGVPTGTQRIYTIQTATGRRLKFTNAYGKVANLGETIQNETFKRMMPAAVAAYNAGGVVAFGPLSVSPQGLSNSKETLPWSQIKGVQISRGYISVNKQGKWLAWSSQPVAKIPNVFVFLTLVDNIIGVKK